MRSGCEHLDFVERDFIVAPHFERLPHLAEVLRQVVGEGIVVVEQQQHLQFPMLAWIRRSRCLYRKLYLSRALP